MQRFSLSLSSFLIIFMLFAGHDSYAQDNVKTQKVGNSTFIVPTIDLLIHYLDQDMDGWKAEMRKLEFTRMQGDGDTAPIFQKGEMEDVCMLISKSKAGIVSVDWYNSSDQESVMNDLFAFMKPYYYAEQDNVLFHKYKKWIVGIEKGDFQGIYFERILIKYE